MKTIVAAIDFSDSSINALEHAIDIARQSESDLVMVWVNNPRNTRITITSANANDLVEDVERQFQRLLTQYQPSLTPSTLSYVVREGRVYDEIVKLTGELKAWLLVTGTHGSSGFEEFWMGSNAYRIVSASACPTLTIRHGRNLGRKLERIILPLDNTGETRQKIPFAAYLAKIYDAEVHILSIFTSRLPEVKAYVQTYANQAAKFLRDEKVRFMKVSVETDNVTTATLDYAESVDANLIVIMTEQEKATRNLLIGPYAQQMVHRSPFPVVSINPAEKTEGSVSF